MANKKLVLDYDFDLIVGPSRPYTDEERAEVSRFIAESKKKPGHAKAVAKLRETVARIDKANEAAKAEKSKHKRR